jgi:hypothetical protein
MLAYVPTGQAPRNDLVDLLGAEGIAQLPPLYDPETIARINAALDPIFKARANEARAYVGVDELVELDLIDTLLGGEMRRTILSIVPDPVLLHCAASEIAAHDTKSHVSSERLDGWHRDWETLFLRRRPTHVSVFVYLSDVGPGDGAFELSPANPAKRLEETSPVVSMMGPAGTSFVWNRTFHHRASPNRGARRRRIFKLSVQPNAFHSRQNGPHPANFHAAMSALPVGDPYMDVMMGRYQNRRAPRLETPEPMKGRPVAPTGGLEVPAAMLKHEQDRHLVLKLSAGRIA